MPDISFATQIAIWGYAVTGNVTETSAMAGENWHLSFTTAHRWDKAADDLRTQFISSDGEPPRRVPDWWALPWLAEHIMRGHAEYVR